MKKLLLFIAFITITQLNSQSFSVFQVKVEKGGEQALLKLFDDTFGDKEFKSGDKRRTTALRIPNRRRTFQVKGVSKVIRIAQSCSRTY